MVDIHFNVSWRSGQRIAMDWMVRGLTLGGGENFRTHPDLGIGSFTGGKAGGEWH